MDDKMNKKTIYSIKRGSQQAQKNIPMLFVCLSITITYIYNTCSQVHTLQTVAQCAAGQIEFEIISNLKGYRTHYLPELTK